MRPQFLHKLNRRRQKDEQGSALCARSVADDMVVGVLQVTLIIPDAMSLKDKRRVIKSLKDRLGARHNISIAEVDDLDEHRRSRIGIALVSNDRRFTQSCLDRILDEIRRHRGAAVLESETELY